MYDGGIPSAVFRILAVRAQHLKVIGSVSCSESVVDDVRQKNDEVLHGNAKVCHVSPTRSTAKLGQRICAWIYAWIYP